MRKSKGEGIKSANLALYFGLLILLIIIISISFKTIDIVRNSIFDGENRFTVAILNSESIELVTVSPSTGEQAAIKIKDAKSIDSIDHYSFPINVFVESDSNFPSDSKNVFLKMLLNKRKIDSKLNLLDLFKLSAYSFGVDSDKFSHKEVDSSEESLLSELSSNEFIDEKISKEKISIQVINGTEIGGLGNKIAKIITNLGGNVVLVNSSKEQSENSVIYFREDSYTVKKISKTLNIKLEKKDVNSISDIVIVLGKDQGK